MEEQMQCFDNGSEFTVTVLAREVYEFAVSWPCSHMRRNRPVTFTFSKSNGDLIDSNDQRQHPNADGAAILALCDEAKAYGTKATRLDAAVNGLTHSYNIRAYPHHTPSLGRNIMETKLYGVSTGNGNNGVSHIFADYYVKTDQPWRLAELAALAQFKPGSGMTWAKEHVEIDGEAEYGISAVFYNPPCNDTADGEYPETQRCGLCEETWIGAPSDCPACGSDETESNDENAEDGRNWCDGNGAWLIIEVFPDTE